MFLLMTLALPQLVFAEQGLLADPLRPVPAAPIQATAQGDGEEASAGLPRLSMIVSHDRKPYAVIDGEARHVGERWGGFRLKAIRSSSVLLEREGGESIEVGLLSGAVIKKNLRP